MPFPKTSLLLIALFLGAFNVFPLLTIPGPGGDIIYHYTLIDCFSSQFWKGDFYPRWCMEADAGLGSPPFLFYFPLSYYFAALFYPLRFLGASIDATYLCILWAINIITFLTCWRWLKEIVSPGRALLCSVFFLWLPYRMELLVYRSAYAELLCVAWLPLLFLFTRRLITHGTHYWLPLCGATAIALLTHVPATLAGLFACGLQVLLLGARAQKIYFAAALLFGGLTTLFYTVPAKYFSRYLYPEVLDTMQATWANSYVVWEDLTTRAHVHLMVGLAVTVMLVIGLSILVRKNHMHIESAYTKKEGAVWMLTAVLAFFLLFEISDPLWKLVTQTLIAAFPWRMQILILCAATYLIAVKMQWLMSAKQLKTWKADYIAAVGITILFGLFMLTTRDEEGSTIFNNMVDNRIVHANLYRTLWTDKKAYETDYIIALGKTLPKAKIIQGRGSITETVWDTTGITLSTDMQTPGVIRIAQRYFPLWQLTIDGQPSDALSPEEPNGLMQIAVPAGKHHLRIVPDIDAAMGWRYTLCKMASLLTAAILIALWFRRFRPAIHAVRQ